jgi:hypothetical protein
MREKGRDIQVHPYVQNAIILAIGAPPIMVLWSAGIGALGLAFNLATSGTVPNVAAPGLASSDTALLGVAAAVGYLYLIWANAVFGESTVEAGMDQADELRGEYQDSQQTDE